MNAPMQSALSGYMGAFLLEIITACPCSENRLQFSYNLYKECYI